MILDSSAVVAVMAREEGHQQLRVMMEKAEVLVIGAPTLLETCMVAFRRFGEEGRSLVDQFVYDWNIEVVPFDECHWRVAAGAFRRYGKGRHPASLNYGDCMSYATAAVADSPLLFVGGDFAKTDVAPV